MKSKMTMPSYKAFLSSLMSMVKIEFEIILHVKSHGRRLVRVVQEDLEVGAGEVGVAIVLNGGFEDGHTVEIAEEVRALDGCGIDTFVAEFAEEATITVVDGIGDTAEVADKIVGGTSVDVIDRHTGRNLLIAPSDIDGMRG